MTVVVAVVPVGIELGQHLLELIQYQQLFKLVPVVLEEELIVMTAIHLILEHLSLLLEEVEAVLVVVLER
jgi:hypothetical protein